MLKWQGIVKGELGYFVRLREPLLRPFQNNPFHCSETFVPRICVVLVELRAPLIRKELYAAVLMIHVARCGSGPA